jgi:hypothetical protein
VLGREPAERTDRHHGPHEEAHARGHPALKAVGREREAHRQLVDVEDRARHAEHELTGREREQRRRRERRKRHERPRDAGEHLRLRERGAHAEVTAPPSGLERSGERGGPAGGEDDADLDRRASLVICA